MMNLRKNKLINDVVKENYHLMFGDCIERMTEMESNIIDLTVTSPPYDNLRTYAGTLDWNFEIFKQVVNELYRIAKNGGVVVWVVGDATIKGSETGTSFRQALYFKEIGFNLHDTMIYSKNSLPKNHNRYEQDFEYMFVFSKGKPTRFNPIMVDCAYPEKDSARKNSYFSETSEKMRSARSGKKRKPVGLTKIKGNIWRFNVGKGHSTKDKLAYQHPAIFPEQLANDHIISWSNENDVVFDPFMGSGTTGKMAKINNRRFIGIEKVEGYFNIAKDRLETTLTNQE